MADVFVSYAVPDSKFADRLARALNMYDVSVFFDRGSLVAGTDFNKEITRALTEAKVVVVLLSANTRRSTWVQEELLSVLERPDGPTVVPVLLDEHAKENWVWPLVSERPGFNLSENGAPIERIAATIAKQLLSNESVPPNKQARSAPEPIPDCHYRKRPLASPSHALQPGTRIAIFAAVLLGLLLVGASVFWFTLYAQLDAKNLGSDAFQFMDRWLPALAGTVIGMLISALFHHWRK